MNLSTLTLEQARNLQPGAETDRIIAEICGMEGGCINWDTNANGRGFGFGSGVPHNEYDLTFTIWSPSTDANHAIEAAEAMESFWDAALIEGCYIACVNTADDGGIVVADGSAFAPTFPLAICRAIAVRAVQQREAAATP